MFSLLFTFRLILYFVYIFCIFVFSHDIPWNVPSRLSFFSFFFSTSILRRFYFCIYLFIEKFFPSFVNSRIYHRMRCFFVTLFNSRLRCSFFLALDLFDLFLICFFFGSISFHFISFHALSHIQLFNPFLHTLFFTLCLSYPFIVSLFSWTCFSSSISTIEK
jgi:hypothetical protein